jgi:hypothetical protein
MTGQERRRAIARIRAQVECGHGCTHFEAVLLLDYCSQMQEELISVYSSEEYALSRIDRRISCWSSGDALERG